MANGKDKNNGGNLGFEAELFKTADKLRGNMEPSDYKHVALGLIFLKYISDAFEAKHKALLAEDAQAAEDKDEYLADNVFWVPKEARWSHLQANAKLPSIGTLIDDAMRAIEKDNESLKGVLPKDYARPALNKVMLGELIDLISGIALNEEGDRSKDILGRVYEYFLGQFAGAEGKRGGEFYTPRSVVRVLVEMLEPFQGRVYDPCCGSGGMFVQSEKFVQEHGGRIGDIAIYGQESNYTTWRLAKMNLAVRGIDSDIRWNNEGSFHKDELRDLKADYILANPPFNISDWGGDRLREDVRWKFGAPPVGNANYAWLQHIVHHLAPKGTAGVVLANGSMSSNQSGEGEIRKAMLEADVVDCMVALPGDWRSSNWSDEVSLEYGKAIRGYSQTHGKYRVFGSNGPIGWTSDALTQGPGVVLGRKGAYRGVEFCREPFWVIDTAYYVVPKTDLDMRWLYYAVKHYKLGEVDDGSPIPSTTRAAVYMLELDVPPKHEQLAIAHILGTLDDKIELNRKQNETLEAMARALFKAWFVDFEPVRAKQEGRWQRGQSLPGLPAHLYDLFPDRLVDSELGEIPEGWRLTSLADFSSLNPESWTKRKRPQEILYVDLSNTKWGRVESVTKYEAADAPSRAQRVLRPLDTIVGTVRPGNGSYALISDENLTGSTGFAVLRPLRREYSEFVYLAATGRENIERLSNLADGGAYPAVRPEIVSATQVPRTGEEVINEFSRQVSSMLAGIASNERTSRTLAQLRDTLLPKLISGELRIKDAEKFMESVTL